MGPPGARVAVGALGRVYSTGDKGASWQLNPAATPTWLEGVDFNGQTG